MKDMNNDAGDEATDRPVSLNKEATPDAAVLKDAATTPTVGSVDGSAALGKGYLLKSDNDDEDLKEEEDFNRERDDYGYIYEGESLQNELGLFYKEQYHTKEKDFDEYIYFNEEEDLCKGECELGYEEDDNNNDDNKEDENKEEGWYEISDRKFAPDPVLPLDISPLSG